jgi:hypothetical protein
VLTPIIHRYVVIFAGMLVQPIVLSVCTVGFMAVPTLLVSPTMKVADRGLSYSINRASKFGISSALFVGEWFLFGVYPQAAPSSCIGTWQYSGPF